MVQQDRGKPLVLLMVQTVHLIKLTKNFKRKAAERNRGNIFLRFLFRQHDVVVPVTGYNYAPNAGN